MLIHFLIRDERNVNRWQSGLFNWRNQRKRSAAAFPLPVTQISRRGPNATLWGQVRPGKGRQSFRLRFNAGAGWRWVPGTYTTTGRGYFTKRVRLPARCESADRGARLAPRTP